MEEAMHLHAYRLLNDTFARKKAKKLLEIATLMGLKIKLSRSQEITARLMGHESWSQLLDTTRTEPERGVPDHMLPAKFASARRKLQIALLVESFCIDTWEADTLLKALAPTSEGAGRDARLIETLGLRLTEEDAAWIGRFDGTSACVRFRCATALFNRDIAIQRADTCSARKSPTRPTAVL